MVYFVFSMKYKQTGGQSGNPDDRETLLTFFSSIDNTWELVTITATS